MGKPRMIGWNSRFVPNSKSDMRFKKKVYQRGREIAERDPYELHAKREMKQLEEMKRGGSAV